jgi:hypothetical protein
MRESIDVNTARLTDAELRTLRGTYAAMSLSESSRTVSAWYAQLARAIDGVLTGRVLEWVGILNDSAVPPSWQIAVDTLPPEGGECR